MTQAQLQQLFNAYPKYNHYAVIAQYNKGKKRNDFSTKRYVVVYKGIDGRYGVDLIGYEIDGPSATMKYVGNYQYEVEPIMYFLVVEPYGLGAINPANLQPLIKNKNYNYYFEKLVQKIVLRNVTPNEEAILVANRDRWNMRSPGGLLTNYSQAKLMDF